MPYRDGSGPMGQGPMTGRGMGPCAGGARLMGGRGMGRGFGGRRGMGYGMGMGFAPPIYAAPTKEMLLSEKAILEAELQALEEKLSEK
ncbi:MAG: DUF5320 domain-containing protein [Sphaerochaeta sp.]|nr:DUF5320 domain-containing protein [Sphaerochaeta sp.]